MPYWLRYKIAQFKYFFSETLPWKIAWWLPSKIALYCFVRVFSIRGDCPPDYVVTYEMWATKHGIN